MSSETATATSSPKRTRKPKELVALAEGFAAAATSSPKRTRTRKPTETPDTPDGAPVTNLYEDAERRAAPELSLAERVRAKAQGHRESV